MSKPEQPLLLLLKAWCLAQHDAAREQQIAALLKEAARSASTELMRPIADRSIAALPDRVLYEIVLEQPVARRNLADWDNLTRLARLAGKTGESLGHLKTAIAMPDPEGNKPERERLLVELLFDTRHPEEALTRAEAIAARPGIEPEEIAALAETLHQWGAPGPAAKFMREVLERRDIAPERRQKLLHRRADMESGLVRWRTLLEAIDALPAGSAFRGASAAIILNEVVDGRQVELAGILADEAKDASLKTSLTLRQAELYAARSNFDAAADLGWKVYEAKQLPEERIEWLCRQLANARRHDKLIQVVEERLRAGSGVDKQLLDSLATAYDVLGRPAAAKRVRTNGGDVKSRPNAGAPFRNSPSPRRF